MTLLFMDSFDHYATATIPSKWTSSSGCTIVSSGRFGSRLRSSNPSEHVTLTVPSEATYIVGFAYLMEQNNSNNVPRLVRLYDGSTEHIRVYTNTSGKFVVERGDGTILGTSSSSFLTNTWYYVELKATISNSAGVIVLRVNEDIEVNLSSQDTQNGGNASINGIRLAGGVNTGQGNIHYWDDLYICDTNGSDNNDFLGDCRAQTILPDGNGNSSQLDGSDGNTTDNYLLVDESTPDSDTTYVESSDVGDKDTYAYGALTPTSGTVFGVQILPFAKKTDAGTRSIASVARLSGTEEDSADKTLSTSYAYLPDIRETKPGGGAWSISDVNSAEFGVKVTA